MKRNSCPSCGSKNFKKNGHIHNGKQNHQCKDCKREFVLDPDKEEISKEKQELAKKMLLERLSLRGICRVLDVSLTWLLGFMVNLFESLPDDLNFKILTKGNDIILIRFEAEVDEMWSFVGDKSNKKWIWIALDVATRQVIAFYVGDREKDSAKELWDRIPEEYKKSAIFYTDQYASYEGVIPEDQHEAVEKGSGLTNHIERFNLTVRQRVSRLVRKALSFSKKVENHIGAIKYFICDYNLRRIEALSN